MTSADEPSSVPDADLERWTLTAHTARLLRYMVEQVRDPDPSSPLARDDITYPWEKCSAWARQNLIAALDHLVQWADIVVPLEQYEGMSVANPPRPYYTLGRAALEAATQAVWLLSDESSQDRVLKHLRLVFHDLRELRNAYRELSDDENELRVQERMDAIHGRMAPTYSKTKLQEEAKYAIMFRECASAIDRQPEALTLLWRGASAAAHGKNWFQSFGYEAEVGEEYEPGYFRVKYRPVAEGVTEIMEAAAAMTHRGVDLLIERSGLSVGPIRKSAMAQLLAVIPLKPEFEGMRDEV